MPPIPPMPPMPPMPPGAPGAFFSGSETMAASVVIISEATDPASISAVLTTFVGSMMPVSFILQKALFWASYPQDSSFFSSSRSTTMDPSKPALSAMVLQGTLRALWTI